MFFVLGGLLVFSVLPLKFRVWWLCALNFAWISSWSPVISLCVFLLIVTAWASAKKKIFSPVLILSLLFLFYFRLKEPELSLGSSFYVLILLGYTIDVATQKSEELLFGETLLLGSFFPLLMAGPVERADQFKKSLASWVTDWEKFFDGALIFSVGFLKVTFLIGPLGELARNLYAGNWAQVIIGALLSILELYVSLSSFADMGRGVARMFGISLVPSFLPVFFAKDPTDFWERWNRTVAQWFRDYLVFPSLLRWGRKIPQNLIVFGAFVILGLWHGFGQQWLLFGIFNGLMVIAGSWLRRKSGSSLPGRILVALLFLGNSVLYSMVDIIGSHEGRSAFLTGLRGTEISVTTVLSFTLFICLEGFREKFHDIDFYLRMKPWMKRGLVILLFLLWVTLVDHRSPVSSTALPLYFEL